MQHHRMNEKQLPFILILNIFLSSISANAAADKQVQMDCTKFISPSFLRDVELTEDDADFATAARVVACTKEQSWTQKTFEELLCRQNSSNSKNEDKAELGVKVFTGVFSLSRQNEYRERYCRSIGKFDYSSWKNEFCSDTTTHTFDRRNYLRFVSKVNKQSLSAVEKCLEAMGNAPVLECFVRDGTSDEPTFHLRWDNSVYGDIKDWRISITNGAFVKKPRVELGGGILTLPLHRENRQEESRVHFDAQLTTAAGKKEFSCSALVPVEACDEPRYLERVSQFCGEARFEIDQGEQCGALLYRMQASESCDVAEYKGKRDAINGVERYNAARGPACGIERYRQCHSTACGRKWNGARKRCRHPRCGPELYKLCRNSAFGVELYRWARRSEFGVESRQNCRDPAHGVEVYKQCAHRDFGVVFNKCRSEFHGLDICQDPKDRTLTTTTVYKPNPTRWLPWQPDIAVDKVKE